MSTTTNIVSSNPTHGEVYLIQHYDDDWSYFGPIFECPLTVHLVENLCDIMTRSDFYMCIFVAVCLAKWKSYALSLFPQNCAYPCPQEIEITDL